MKADPSALGAGLIDMIIYIVILAIALIGSVFIKSDSHPTIKRTYLFITFVPLIFISCIRAETVGSDTALHTTAFKYFADGYTMSDVMALDRFEFGFVLLNRILSFLSDDSQLLIIVSSLFILSSVAVFIYRNSTNVAMSTILYITLNEYAMHMNVMREALAIAIFLYAFEFLKKNKIGIYVLLVLIAAQFHTVAYIFLILILFRKVQFTMKSFFISLAMCGVGFIFGRSIFNFFTLIFTQYAGYGTSEFADSNYFAAVLNASVAMVVFLFGIAYIYNKRKKSYVVRRSEELIGKKDEIAFSSVEHIDLAAYCMALYTVFSFCVIQMTIFNRLKTCFSIFTILWIPYGHSLIKSNEEKGFTSWLIVGFTIIYFVIIAQYRPEWYGIVPYAVAESFPLFQ